MIPQNQGKIIVRNNHKEHYLTNQEKPYPNKCKQKINEKLKESKHYEIENMKKNKKNAQLPRRNFEFNFQIKKKNPREPSSPIHYSKKLKHKHKQENQIDENILHE